MMPIVYRTDFVKSAISKKDNSTCMYKTIKNNDYQVVIKQYKLYNVVSHKAPQLVYI